MDKPGIKRRDFVKLGLVTAAASALGSGIMKPVGLWAATPTIKGPIKVGYQAVLSGTLAGYGEFHKMGALMAWKRSTLKADCRQQAGDRGRDSTWLHPPPFRTFGILWIAGKPIFWRESIHRGKLSRLPRSWANWTVC